MAKYSAALSSLRGLGDARSSIRRKSSLIDYTLGSDYEKERRQLERNAEDVTSRSSWGRMAGVLGAGALSIVTGGLASPLLAAAMVGGGSYLGSKVGEATGADIKDNGKFLSRDRKSFTDQLHTGQLKNAATDFIAAYSLGNMKIPGGDTYSQKFSAIKNGPGANMSNFEAWRRMPAADLWGGF